MCYVPGFPVHLEPFFCSPLSFFNLIRHQSPPWEKTGGRSWTSCSLSTLPWEKQLPALAAILCSLSLCWQQRPPTTLFPMVVQSSWVHQGSSPIWGQHDHTHHFRSFLKAVHLVPVPKIGPAPWQHRCINICKDSRTARTTRLKSVSTHKPLAKHTSYFVSYILNV